MTEVHDVPRKDETAVLAERLGVPVENFVDVFGRWWFKNEAEPWHDYDSDPDGGGGLPVTPWHSKGDPPQLMLRVFHHGVFIACPEGTWPGPTLEYHAAKQVYVPNVELAEKAPSEVSRLLKARRRRFRWCPECWSHTPPEMMLDAWSCMGCFDGQF